MANAFKLFDPNTGLVVFRDCLTGAELDAAQIAAVVPCPKQDIETDQVCIQPIGNLDPALIESDAKRVCTIEISYLADGSVDATAVVNTMLINAAGADVTTTHEVTACPAGLIAVGEVCYS